jgi:ubiquitin carboxyl-terminal hydrolase 25/28
MTVDYLVGQVCFLLQLSAVCGLRRSLASHSLENIKTRLIDVNDTGKTAPRLINDLQDYDPRYLPQNVRNLLVDPAPIYKGTPILRKGVRDCRHVLMRKDEQTTAIISNDDRPRVEKEYVVSAYCTLCRCHFKISMDYSRKHDSQVPCNLADEANPIHHLRPVGSIYAKEYSEKYGRNKYDPLTEAHQFVCSSPTCPLKVEIKLSPPRLSSKRLAAILDPGKVDARGRKEIHNDPVRLEGKKPVTPLQALSFLRTYLFDAKSAANTTEQRKIAKRNKSYMLAFANECDPIFEYLDFTPFEAESSDVDVSFLSCCVISIMPQSRLLWAVNKRLGLVPMLIPLLTFNLQEGVNQFWRLPVITDANRNFFEDVLVEIDLHITDRSKPEQQAALTRPIHKPVPALKDIERSLGYSDYPTRSRTIDLSTEEHPHYLSLGVVDNFTDDLLIWAYDRQCECDPSNKPYYLDCLQGIATGRESPDLQMRVVMATSNGEHGLKAIEKAYKYFSLSPDTKEADNHIMGLYKSRIVSAPRQKDEAREYLLILAKARIRRGS